MGRHAFFATDYIKIPKIYSIGFSGDPKITRYGPSKRNEYIIHYVLSGKGYFNGSRIEAGEGFLITPGLEEEYFPDEKEPWSFVWIISGDSEMKYFFERHCADEKSGVFKFTNKYALVEIAKILSETKYTPAPSTQISELFLRIFNSCIDNKDKASTCAPNIYFEFSVNYIKSNLHLGVTVFELCQAVGISQQYLYKIFKKETGMSPKEYISAERLKAAKKLLQDTNFSITQIAESTGFDSVLTFSKFFKKQTGISPSTYRSK